MNVWVLIYSSWSESDSIWVEVFGSREKAVEKRLEQAERHNWAGDKIPEEDTGDEWNFYESEFTLRIVKEKVK